MLSHMDETRVHTRPPYQEKVLTCWPGFAGIGCVYSVLVKQAHEENRAWILCERLQPAAVTIQQQLTATVSWCQGVCTDYA